MIDRAGQMTLPDEGGAGGWPARLHAAVYHLIWFFLFMNPFPVGESVKEICYYTAITLFAGLAVSGHGRYRFRSPLMTPLLIYAGWVLIGVAFALDRPRSLHDFLSHLVKNIGLFLIIANYWADRRQVLRLAWTFSVAAVVFCSVSLVYFYGFTEHSWLQRFGVGFTNASVNVMGYTTLLAALMIFTILRTPGVTRGQRWFLNYGFWVCMAASILPQSRGTLLAMLAAFFVISRRKTLLVILAGVTLILAVITPMRDRMFNAEAYDDRIFRIFYSWELIKDHPVTGTGFSLDALKDPAVIDDAAYRARLPQAYRDYWQEFVLPHSLLLNVPVRTGLVGLVLFMGIAVQFARTGWRLARCGQDPFVRSWSRTLLACMVMYLVKGAFEPVDTALVEVIFFSILALQVVLWRMDVAAPAAPEGDAR